MEGFSTLSGDLFLCTLKRTQHIFPQITLFSAKLFDELTPRWHSPKGETKWMRQHLSKQVGGFYRIAWFEKSKKKNAIATYKETNCNMQWRGGRREEPEAEEEPAIDLEERERQEPNTEWEE